MLLLLLVDEVRSCVRAFVSVTNAACPRRRSTCVEMSAPLARWRSRVDVSRDGPARVAALTYIVVTQVGWGTVCLVDR